MLDEVIEVYKTADDNNTLYPGEVIKDVIGYEDFYQVTSLGRIWSINSQKWLKQTLTHRGYLKVNLSKCGIVSNQDVHLLVLKAFKPIPDRLKGMYVECRHLDRNKENNRIDNLEWGTHSINENDKIIHGTDNSGERNGRAKFTIEEIKEIRRLHREGIGINELGRMKGVSGNCIWSIVHKITWADIED